MNESSIARALEIACAAEEPAFAHFRADWLALSGATEPTIALVEAVRLPAPIAEKLPAPLLVVSPSEPSCQDNQIAAADLVVASMAALRLFPGDFAAAFARIRASRIPCWAVVTKANFLDDPDTFEAMQKSAMSHDWPEGSCYFSGCPESAPAEAEKMATLWDQQKARFFQNGRQRRLCDFAAALRQSLSDRAAAADAEAEALDRAIDLGHSGLAALKARAKSAGSEPVARLSADLKTALRKWVDDLQADILATDNREGAFRIKECLDKRLRELLDKRLAQITGPHLQAAQAGCTAWVEHSVAEFERFFGAFAVQTGQSAEVAERARAGLPTLADEITRWSAAQHTRIFEVVSRFREVLQGKWLLNLLGMLSRPVGGSVGKLAGSLFGAGASKKSKGAAAGNALRIWKAVEILSEAQKAEIRTELDEHYEAVCREVGNVLAQNRQALEELLVESVEQRGALLGKLSSAQARAVEGRLSALRQARACLDP